jgi:SAM-dependent methyltransferase
MALEDDGKPENLWNSTAPWWDSLMGDTGDWFQRFVLHPALLALLKDPKGLSILDAGCGNGHLSRFLARKGAKITAADLSKGLLERARSYEMPTDLNINYINCDLTQPISGVIEGQFDTIVSNMVIQDVEDHAALLTNLKTLLKQEGRMLISTRHPCFEPTSEKLGWLLTLPGNKTVTTGHGLSSLLESTDFKGEVFQMDHYFREVRFFRQWTAEYQTPSFHRTLETLFSSFAEAGFSVAGIVEPSPTDEGMSVAPSLGDLLTRMPHFIIFELRHRFD